jgi:hypothetical protein
MPTKPTVTVTKRGEITSGAPRVGFRRGFADLLDFTSPPSRVAILPRDAPTAIGATRTGTALRDAITAFGKTKP